MGGGWELGKLHISAISSPVGVCMQLGCTQVCVRMRACVHAYVCVTECACLWVWVCYSVHACLRACVCVCVHACVSACLCKRVCDFFLELKPD